MLIMGVFLTTLHALAQTGEEWRRFELLGAVNYSYSDDFTTKQSSRYGSKEHVLSVQPSIGYFLLSDLELQFDTRYTMSFFENTSTNASTASLVRTRNTVHGVGMAVGITYHISLGRTAGIFVTPKFGVGWTRLIGSSTFWYYDQGWGKPEISFPMFVLGARFAISDNWNLLTFFQYSRTHPYQYLWYQDRTKTQISIGFGFSRFL